MNMLTCKELGRQRYGRRIGVTIIVISDTDSRNDPLHDRRFGFDIDFYVNKSTIDDWNTIILVVI
jgi:hypothetical protein